MIVPAGRQNDFAVPVSDPESGNKNWLGVGRDAGVFGAGFRRLGRLCSVAYSILLQDQEGRQRL